MAFAPQILQHHLGDDFAVLTSIIELTGVDIRPESLRQCHKSVWDSRLRMLMEVVRGNLVGGGGNSCTGIYFFVSRHNILLYNTGILHHPLCFGVVGAIMWAVGGGAEQCFKGLLCPSRRILSRGGGRHGESHAIPAAAPPASPQSGGPREFLEEPRQHKIFIKYR